ncbi:BLUF domain-containing protein [Simiduia sp. 21SJ11W-1]|uniref:BLUF domain-containing protein n=1 Tax=Simiduia sp. 21SJ11W-1 TaxID=2909669 RepID=UPI0020A05563|nr:BLUF domain-containing protein [Simiduia sp. 21SJ11W-1]UTA47691.1 BLUF domain-containing protein [Simiduia sp. 21SJ11W-1]
MLLTRLVYTSTISSAFTSDDLEKILEISRKNNPKKGITGMLFFNQKYFLQCLEGSRQEVNATYHKLAKDARHTNIIILDYKEVDFREFSAWSMGYLPESSLTAPIILKYSGLNAFNPYEMSGESAHKMMLELHGNANQST